jgi:hypothetical protein
MLNMMRMMMKKSEVFIGLQVGYLEVIGEPYVDGKHSREPGIPAASGPGAVKC